MKKKRVGYGDFYCWNCGKRIILGEKNCPYCHARYSGKNKVNETQQILSVHPSIHHRTFFLYQLRTLSGFLLAMALFTLIVPLIIWVSEWGDISFEYIYSEVMPGLCLILWTFWIVWLIFNFRSQKKRRKAILQNNRNSGQILCASCGHHADENDNYCSRCGCILLK